MDTGPLVAYLSRRDAYHDWAIEQLAAFDPPLTTCEAVLTETCFVAARNGVQAARVLQLLAPVVRIGLRLDEELPVIGAIMTRYQNVPMSLADACLVRLAELTDLPICTLDTDFTIYRTSRGRTIDLIMPHGPYGLHEP
jgi:uncharacterized protein